MNVSLVGSFPSKPDVDTIVTHTEASALEGLSPYTWFRLTTVFTPATTGILTFLLSAGGPARLWVTGDLNRPSLAPLAAATSASTGFRSWGETASQRSVDFAVEAGEQYYMEVQGHGSHVTVGAELHRGLFNSKDTMGAADEVQVRPLTATSLRSLLVLGRQRCSVGGVCLPRVLTPTRPPPFARRRYVWGSQWPGRSSSLPSRIHQPPAT